MGRVDVGLHFLLWFRVDNKRGELVRQNIPKDSKGVSLDSRVEPVLSGADGLGWLYSVSFVHSVRKLKNLIQQLDAKGK